MMERRGLPMLNHVLQHTLRSLCCDTQWVYAVFWRILPRNYPPPKWENEGGAIDRSKGNKRNWILVWEDGFCDFPACTSSGREAQIANGSRYGNNHGYSHANESAETATAMHPELFFKMSHEVYNYGEGLMGKVAADNSHKWVYREPMEHEMSFLSPWHGSLDPHPRTWEAQFKTGIQTIAVISVREGLVQLGSTKKVVEDLNFVILMQRKFNYLQSIPGVFVPHPSSPLPGMKRRDGGKDGSSPTDGSIWPGSRDQNLISGLFSRSNGDHPYRTNTHIKQFSTGVLGIKRPPDNEIPLGLSTSGRDFPFLSPGINFNGSPRFDCRQSNGLQPECPSPPKSLNTGQSPNSISLLPSMSSLHNLLSKLPSVITAEESSACISSSPTGLSLASTAHHLQRQQQVLPRQPMSPCSSTDSPIRSMSAQGADEQQNPSPRSSSSPSRQQQQQQRQQQHSSGNDSPGPMSTSPHVDHDGSASGAGDTGMSTRSSRSELTDSRSSLGDHHGHHRPAAAPMGPAPHKVDKLTSFLDSFDHDSLTDLDLQDALENSETYNSFLSEII